ncbi:MAG: quinone-dependent dihydroorotate dehydrogenase [Crocinitomicaceae bacterium]|nr:quinone-dependent dihydroorotate dehydrogenase [Crocinitomicaceae bacterium]
MILYNLFRSLVFLLPAEKAHYFTVNLLKLSLKVPFSKLLFKKLFCLESPLIQRTVFGIDFPNPIGLAAGFDKNATCFNEMEYCGFGFVEIGTVTPLAQDGNDKPRLFRLKKDKAIINRMGFNNNGMAEAVENLKRKSPGSKLIIGGNIGKNKITSNENAIDDYIVSFKALFDYVDYFVVNVSSPNTPDLRALQEKEPLKKILAALQLVNESYPTKKPLLLKIAPDLSNEQLDDIVEIMLELKMDGIVATNTTIQRTGLVADDLQVEKIGAGGLSGKPLSQRSTEVIRYIHQKSKGAFPIMGVGGIDSVEDALEKLDAGATLLQIYTGFIYEGPMLNKRINKAILTRLNNEH